MKTIRLLVCFLNLSFIALAADEAPVETPSPPAFEEYSLTVEGLGEITVIAPEGEPGYRVRLPSGAVTAFPAHSGAPSQENAAADIAYARAHPPALPVPESVTRRQLLLALFTATGVKDTDILTSLGQIADPATRYVATVEFAQASEFRRGHPLVAQLAAQLHLTSAQVDDIFRAAAKL